MDIFIKLLGVAMLPVIVSIIFYLLKRRSPFYGLAGAKKQIIVGTVFGIVAICGTLWGVDVGGATANCRDAAPLCAGFFFGGPAAIIAGCIGGIYRWISAPTTGEYTKVACSVSTIVAGLYAAALRKYVFDYKRPKWLMAALVGLVMETFHMTMVFFTHMDDVQRALEIIKVVTIPMVLCNAFAVGLAAACIQFISYRVLHRHKEHTSKRINERIQTKMLAAVVATFLFATVFIIVLQTTMAYSEADDLLSTNLVDVESEIRDTMDRNMLKTTHKVGDVLDRGSMMSLTSLADTYDITEINIVDDNGIIVDSNFERNIGLDVKKSKEISEFMSLTEGTQELVTQFEEVKFGGQDEIRERKYAGVTLKEGGFVLLGYDRESFTALLVEEMEGITANRHIGNTGGLFIVDSDKEIISATYGSSDKTAEKILYNSDSFNIDGVLYAAYINDSRSLCKCVTAEGYYLLAYIPRDEAMISRDLEAYLNIFLQILVFAIIFARVFFLVKKIVVNDIYKVNGSLKKITEGDLDERVDVHSAYEFDQLSDAINETVERLEQYTVEAKERMKQDLEIAANIQKSSLPQNFEEIQAIEQVNVYATMTPAKEVGGDFYDFLVDRSGKFVFGIADVSGKGVPGAMFMMRAKTMIRGCVDTGLDIGEVFTQTNRLLCEGNDAEMFVTAWMGVLDLQTGHVEFANAGHNPPLVYRKGEGYSYLKSKVGFVLAGMDGIRYKLQELDLAPGDKIFLYTDGVTEAQNKKEELYGEDRLLACLNRNMDKDDRGTIQAVKADMDKFVADAEQFDDITMMLVEYKGPEKI